MFNIIFYLSLFFWLFYYFIGQNYHSVTYSSCVSVALFLLKMQEGLDGYNDQRLMALFFSD